MYLKIDRFHLLITLFKIELLHLSSEECNSNLNQHIRVLDNLQINLLFYLIILMVNCN